MNVRVATLERGRRTAREELRRGRSVGDVAIVLVGLTLTARIGTPPSCSAYDLPGRKQKDAAIEIFRLNTELYPESGNTCDSLAETYLPMGDEARAKELYAKALAVQPDYTNAKEPRQIVEGKSN